MAPQLKDSGAYDTFQGAAVTAPRSSKRAYAVVAASCLVAAAVVVMFFSASHVETHHEAIVDVVEAKAEATVPEIADTAASGSCTYQQGDGTGGSEEYLGTTSTRDACTTLVQSSRSSANGATYSMYGTACFAEYGMTGDNDSGSWQTCLFGATGCTHLYVRGEGCNAADRVCTWSCGCANVQSATTVYSNWDHAGYNTQGQPASPSYVRGTVITTIDSSNLGFIAERFFSYIDSTNPGVDDMAGYINSIACGRLIAVATNDEPFEQWRNEPYRSAINNELNQHGIYPPSTLEWRGAFAAIGMACCVSNGNCPSWLQGQYRTPYESNAAVVSTTMCPVLIPCYDFSGTSSVSHCHDTYCSSASATSCLTATCATGYSGYSSSTGQCSANWCSSSYVANSAAYYYGGSISGTTGTNHYISCATGYSGGGYATCQTSGYFSIPTCTPNACATLSGTGFSSTYSGYTGDQVYVNCQAGFSGGGWSQCQTNGYFSGVACHRMSCNTKYYSNSNYAWPGVNGVFEDTVTVSCNEGYRNNNNAFNVNCQSNNYFTDGTCDIQTCAVKNYANSNYASGLATQTNNWGYVSCDAGYSGGGYVYCQTNGQMQDTWCTPNYCTSTSVPYSNYYGHQSISGRTTDSIEVVCDAGYSGGGTTTCQTDGTFSSVSCTPNPCTSYSVANSNYATANAIAGVTTNAFYVQCDINYFGSGWTSCQTDGTFSPQPECEGFAYLGCYNQDQIPGWPSWNCEEGADSYYVNCARLSGTHHEMAAECGRICSERGATYFDIHDTTACFCGAGTNRATEAPVFDATNGHGIPSSCKNYQYAIDSAVAPCASYSVQYSNYAGYNSIWGTTGETFDVDCFPGYSGSATTTCMSTQAFSDVVCTADPCESTQVANSEDYGADGSIEGRTTDSVFVQCKLGYSGTDVTVCQPDHSFTDVTCSPNDCQSDNTLHSDKRVVNSIVGKTTDIATVTCDTGYSPNADADGGPAPGPSGGSKDTTCNPPTVRGQTGVFDTVTCTPMTCPSTSVDYSDFKEAESIQGVVDEHVYVTCDLGYAGSGWARCENTVEFSVPECIALPCAPYEVAHSSHSEPNSINGFTTDIVTVTCDPGYSPTGPDGENGGSIDTMCQPISEFEEVTCTPIPCDPYQVQYSDFEAEGSITAVMDEEVVVTCIDGYSTDKPHYMTDSGSARCLATETFSEVICSPHPCNDTDVMNSDYKDEDSITGYCTDEIRVTCDAGYSTKGEWGSPQGKTLRCNEDRLWDEMSCPPNPCDAISVANSNYANEESITGRTTDQVTVTCDVGYVIAAHYGMSEENPNVAITECLTNGTFSYISCKPASSLDLYIYKSADKPVMIGADENDVPIWEHEHRIINIDYWADAYLSKIEGTPSYTSVTFRLRKNALGFKVSLGSKAEEGAMISLYTDFEGAFFDYGDEEGTLRNRHTPNGDHVDMYEIVWDVAGVLGKLAALTVEDADPTAQIAFDDVRNFDAQQGCLPECITMRAEACDWYRDGYTCFFFQDDPAPYVPVAVSAKLTQYCRHGEAPFGENGASSLLTGWIDDVIDTTYLQATPLMPECIFLELLGPAEFGIAVSEDRIEFQFSGSNETVPDPLYWDPDADFNTYCMFDTHKPRCADYSGILRSRTQHNIACKEVEPELSCLEIMYEAHCEGKSDPCGEKKVTRDLMKCCAKSYNDPGSGCLSRRRRRLNEAVEMAVITDVEAATQCAESCFRRAMGPSASVADACVAWRLEDNGACVLSNGCYFAEAADLLLLDRKLWNTIEGVDMFKGARAPAPKRVRRVKGE